MGAALAIALSALVLGADLRIDAGLRAESRSRTLDVAGPESLTSAEVAASPRVGLQLLSPDVDLDLLYAPAFRAPDVTTSTRHDVLHVAELQALVRAGSAWTVTGLAGAARGTTDLLTEYRRTATLQETAPAPSPTVPTTEELRYVWLHGDATVEGSLDSRTTARLTAGWFAGGGDDEPSRATLPFEHGVRGAAGLEWSATRRDGISLHATALDARFAGEREAGLASITAGWRRRLDRTTEASVRGGAQISWISGTTEQAAQRAYLAAGEAGVSHASERLHTTEELTVRTGAVVDRIHATVDREYGTAGSVRWTPGPALTFGGRASAARVDQQLGHLWRGALELSVDWATTRRSSTGFGVYALWQRTPDPALASFVEWGAFAYVALDVLGERGRAGAPITTSPRP